MTCRRPCDEDLLKFLPKDGLPVRLRTENPLAPNLLVRDPPGRLWNLLPSAGLVIHS